MGSPGPFLLGSSSPLKVELYRDQHCLILDRGFAISMELTREWRRECANLIEEFGVERLVASEFDGWDGQSIAFLDELPAPLRSVRISTTHVIDWRPLERQAELEAISVNSERESQGEIDFAKLPRLVRCRIKWLPQWDSVLHCSWLKSLAVTDSFEPGTLDLGGMIDLEELVLESLGAVREVRLADQSVLRALKISHCPRLIIDLRRFVTDLEFLWIEGRTGYPLDALASALKLEKLTLVGLNNQVVPPPFVRHLKYLRGALVLKTRLCEADMALIRGLGSSSGTGTLEREKGT